MRNEILVVREKDVFSSILIERGFSTINFPVIKTEPLADLSKLKDCLNKNFDGIFITSVKAAEIVAAQLKKMRKDFGGKFFVLGKKSADLLKNAGFEIYFDEAATTAEEFLTLIPKEELTNKNFLFACGNRSLRIIPEKLAGIANVVETIVYQTIAIVYSERERGAIAEKLNRKQFAALCFFSPSGIEGFLKNFRDETVPIETTIAVIGKTTASCAENNGLRVDFTSVKPSAADFAAELVSRLRKEI